MKGNYRLNDPRRGRQRPHLDMNGTTMKIYGCVTMFLYALSRSVFQQGLIGMDQYGPGELAAAMEADPDLMVLSGWASVLQLIGGLAVPVFAFLLVEGFLHTRSYKRYFLTMFLFAAVSEVPYDLAMYGKAWDMGGQNALFTYTLCLVMLYGLGFLDGKKGFVIRLCQVVLVGATVMWAMLLRCAFGLVTVLLAAIYYLWREKNGTRVLLGCAVSILYVTAPLSGYAIYNYDGQRGKIAAKYKYVFYALYPIHLLVLGLISKAV